MNTDNNNGRKDPIINRRIITSVTIYEVTDSELDKFKEGSSGTTELTFAIGLLSAFISFTITLLTVDITSDRIFTAFLCCNIICLILGLFFLKLWFPKKSTVPKLIEKIKQRKIDEGGNIGIYEVAPFLRRLKELEKNNNFLAVSWLQNTIFRDKPDALEALQVCIDKQYVSIYKVDNPKHPGRQVSCCKINRDHVDVQKII